MISRKTLSKTMFTKADQQKNVSNASPSFTAVKVNQQGLTLIEALIAVALIGLATSLSLQVYSTYIDRTKQREIYVSLQLVRTNLVSVLTSQEAWVKTVDHVDNTSLSCLRLGIDCAGAGGGVILYNESSSLYYDSVSVGSDVNGFSLFGSSCNSFNAVDGNNLCPIRARVTWSPLCPSAGPCVSPLARVQVQFEVSAGPNFVMPNPARLSFEVLRSYP